MSLEIEDLEATSVMSPLHARDEIVVEASEKTKVDNMDYSTVVMDGQERFACNNCDFKSDKIKGIKRHHNNARGDEGGEHDEEEEVNGVCKDGGEREGGEASESG